MIHEITDENFETEVMDAGTPCVIEFTSDWCVLCKDMVPAFEKVAEELGDKVKFCSVDTSKQRKLGITFAVGSLPYVVYVANGEMTPALRRARLGGQVARARAVHARRRRGRDDPSHQPRASTPVAIVDVDRRAGTGKPQGGEGVNSLRSDTDTKRFRCLIR